MSVVSLVSNTTPTQHSGGSLARIEMDLKALDLAAESLRHHKIDQVSPECPGSPLIHPKPRSFSQPVSPARVVGETSKGAPIGQEPMNDCDVDKVRLTLMTWPQMCWFCVYY